MKPAIFDYHRAEDFEHARHLLAEYGDDAKILAGGQSLIAAMNYRLARPSVLVDISNIADACLVEDEQSGVRVRATTTQRYAEKHDSIGARLPVLQQAIEHIAHFQIRNKGTVGGSITNADPASELPAMSVLLNAELEVASSSERRTIPAEEFYVTYMTTTLAADEVLESVLFVEPPAGCGWGFNEIARRDGDFALAGGAAVVGTDAEGRCNYARVTVFGVDAVPVRASEVETAIVGNTYSAECVKDAATLIRDLVEPEGDVHVSEAYRRDAAAVVTRRALEDAFSRAQKS
ncbi:MAG: FAD binding domain-containing protein [Gammaproteobacteria bacterium]